MALLVQGRQKARRACSDTRLEHFPADGWLIAHGMRGGNTNHEHANGENTILVFRVFVIRISASTE
jgi:hypothetical protein